MSKLQHTRLDTVVELAHTLLRNQSQTARKGGLDKRLKNTLVSTTTISHDTYVSLLEADTVRAQDFRQRPFRMAQQVRLLELHTGDTLDECNVCFKMKRRITNNEGGATILP